jgi:hypothetical protein
MAAVTTPRQSLVFFAVSGRPVGVIGNSQLVEIWHKITIGTRNYAEVYRSKIGQFFDLNQLLHGQSD